MALAVALAVALCSVGMVLWRVVAGRVLLWGRVGSLGAAGYSILSMVVVEGLLLRSVGGGDSVSEVS